MSKRPSFDSKSRITATVATGTPMVNQPIPTQMKQVGPLLDLRTVHRCEHCGAFLIGTPLIECGHGGTILPIRCFRYRKGDQYYAECLDLDLIARGDTEEEAIGRLQGQMFGYVHTVTEEGSAKGLIPRRAPLSSWIHYYATRTFDRLARLFTKRHRPSLHTVYNLGVTRLTHC